MNCFVSIKKRTNCFHAVAIDPAAWQPFANAIEIYIENFQKKGYRKKQAEDKLESNPEPPAPEPSHTTIVTPGLGLGID